ncbi:Pleiotropic drug resistance protein transporter [Phytophthora megakarya]|uniref:Pleiotropic drug resistance protein transporter n=1 Tax=Phytophthora megakarya TaxID=4795 RepID=A0A225WDQ8_9STRA|nr:Pleiotropic drug resistance protein transporter [Phytophthora megakarya]
MGFGNKTVMVIDENDTGLDNATAFDVITTQRSITKKFRKTVMISLLQQSSEVFKLFDDVVNMIEGHLMYHHPHPEALGTFKILVFEYPLRRDKAETL